jgi:hypothetical protein
VLRRQLVGHVTEEMQRHYSSVDIDESRTAMAAVFRVAPLGGTAQVGTEVGTGDRNDQRPGERSLAPAAVSVT